ncbi:hypothetical protein [Radiobacillus sp. PE A8.2]
MKVKTLSKEKIRRLENAAQGVYAVPSQNKMSDELTKKKIEELKKKKRVF